jgi:hypothetical protein
LRAPQPGEPEARHEQRGDGQGSEPEQVDHRLTSQPPFVVRADESTVEGEGDGAGELHGRQDQQTGREPSVHRRIAAEHMR